MNELLRSRLVKAAAGGTLAIAAVLQSHFESSNQRPLVPYRDPANIWTVCHGVTGPEVVPGKTYTTAECEALERKHLAIAEAAARRQIVVYDRLNRFQQAALVDFTYNAGEGNLASSTMRRLFNSGQTDAGCRELIKWVKSRVNGALITLDGLVDRRSVEMELCLSWGRT